MEKFFPGQVRKPLRFCCGIGKGIAFFADNPLCPISNGLIK
jgi:hypothetical protein